MRQDSELKKEEARYRHLYIKKNKKKDILIFEGGREISPASEARLRAGERASTVSLENTHSKFCCKIHLKIKVREISEGRMRADARGGGPVTVPSEGRLRAAGQVFQAVPCFTFAFHDAFILIFSGREQDWWTCVCAKGCWTGIPSSLLLHSQCQLTFQGGNSITQNLSQSPAPRMGPMPPAYQVPRSTTQHQ